MRIIVVLLLFLTLPLSVIANKPTTATLRQETTGFLFVDEFRDESGRSGPELVYIEAQEYLMGSRPEAPRYTYGQHKHEVALSPFSIGRYEVTTAEFCEFLNEEGNQIDQDILWILTNYPEICPVIDKNGRFISKPGFADRPVVTVSWNGARAYCRWLSRKTGQTYRLPTEAEWECAARAGTQTIWPWGDDFDPHMARGVYAPLRKEGTAPVGSYPPNDWGIYDMIGNVWEWVLDCHEENFYEISPRQDPVQYDEDCWTPGIRGGSFKDAPEMTRPGYRVNTWWWGEYDGVGFRVVREEVTPRWAPNVRRRERVRQPMVGPQAP